MEQARPLVVQGDLRRIGLSEGIGGNATGDAEHETLRISLDLGIDTEGELIALDAFEIGRKQPVRNWEAEPVVLEDVFRSSRPVEAREPLDIVMLEKIVISIEAECRF